MRGGSSVIGFGLMGLLVLVLAHYTNDQMWCGEKLSGCGAVAADIDYLVGLIALGIFGLLAMMLVGSLRLVRPRRPHG